MNVFLDFLGCRLNEAEIQLWAAEFQNSGLKITSQLIQADIIVINTCAVTGEAARKSRQKIRKIHKQAPLAKVVVTGCYVTLEPKQVAEILGVDLVIDNSEKESLAQRVLDELIPETSSVAAIEPDSSVVFAQNRDRAFIKIQDGCRYRCTYCIVTVARGDEKSRSIDELIKEINHHFDMGIFEIVLTGVHVGGYGSDINSSLFELVQEILKRTQMPRIRFASVEPWDLPDDFFDLFDNPRLMPHMHLPIQSGSDQILKKMSRRCRTDDFLALIKRAKTRIPSFNVTTDIIVGFPGEGDEQWQQTLDYVRRLPLGHIHIFAYSNREGTKAASLKPVVDNQTKKQRSKQLHEIASELKLQQLQKQVGFNATVLLESEMEPVGHAHYAYWGHTENYFKLKLVSQSRDLSGNLVQVQISDVDIEGGFLIGTFVQNEMVSKRMKPISVTQL